MYKIYKFEYPETAHRLLSIIDAFISPGAIKAVERLLEGCELKAGWHHVLSRLPEEEGWYEVDDKFKSYYCGKGVWENMSGDQSTVDWWYELPERPNPKKINHEDINEQMKASNENVLDVRAKTGGEWTSCLSRDIVGYALRNLKHGITVACSKDEFINMHIPRFPDHIDLDNYDYFRGRDTRYQYESGDELYVYTKKWSYVADPDQPVFDDMVYRRKKISSSDAEELSKGVVIECITSIEDTIEKLKKEIGGEW